MKYVLMIFFSRIFLGWCIGGIMIVWILKVLSRNYGSLSVESLKDNGMSIMKKFVTKLSW